MVIVIAIAAALIVAATYLSAKGMGGELARFPRDRPEFWFQPRWAADLFTLELPVALFGFQEEATASALNAVGRLLAAREAEVAYLRAELGRLSGGRELSGLEPGGPGAGGPDGSEDGGPGGGGPGGGGPGGGGPGGAGAEPGPAADPGMRQVPEVPGTGDSQAESLS